MRGHYAGVEPHFASPVGFEGVGIVDALGPQVDGPVPGQRVVVINRNGGNWAEYAVVSEKCTSGTGRPYYQTTRADSQLQPIQKISCSPAYPSFFSPGITFQPK